MNTLIIFTEDKIGQALKAGRIRNPFEKDMFGGSKLNVIPKTNPRHQQGTPSSGDVVGAAYESFEWTIKDNIATFARECLKNEPKRPKPQDIVELQIVFVFHQSQVPEIEAMVTALTDLPLFSAWANVTDGQGYMLRVKNVVLMSCESGAHKGTNRDPLLIDYLTRAAALQNAARLGLATEVKPPPSNPREYFPYPVVLSFTTGDPVTGGLVLDPNHAKFVSTPEWGLTRDGQIAPFGDPDKEVPAAGSVYRLNPDGSYSKLDVPTNGTVDVLRDPGLSQGNWQPAP